MIQPSNGAAARAIPPIVLVVEDDRDTREMYEALLNSEGFRVMKVDDAIEACDSARDFHPHAVMTDLGLHGDADGAGPIPVLRADPEFECTPIIAAPDPQHGGNPSNSED